MTVSKYLNLSAPLGIPLGIVLTLGVMLLDGRANSAEEGRIINLAQNHPNQGRASLSVDPILSRAAQLKAGELLSRRHFSHTNPEGYGPNYLVRALGYVLPSYYGTAKGANHIESFHFEGGSAPVSANRAWNAWMNSPAHRIHILGTDPFFAAQTHIGVGIARGGYGTVYVFMTAPPPGPGGGVVLDRKGPNVTLKADRSGKKRASPFLRFKGRATDPLGIKYVRYKVGGKRWRSGGFQPPSGQWKGKARLRRSTSKKLRKRRKPVSVRIDSADKLGNAVSRSRGLRG